MPAAVAIPAIAAVVGGAIAAKGSKDAAKTAAAANQAQIDANKVDPRITDMLFGSGTKTLKDGVTPNWVDSYDFGTGQTSQTLSNPESDYNADNGLLGRYAGLLDTPQKLGMQQFGQANDNYIGAFTAHDLEAARGGATKLLAGDTPAPTMQAASAGTAQVNAPSQNGMDLTSSYKSLIDGDPGNNPFLTGAIGKGINQSNAAFGALQRDSTKNLLETVLPSIRSGAVIAGGYGGSRHGIAEGKALDAFATEQQRTLSQVGQNNTDAAVTAQAGAYDADRNRQLAATQGLSGQQYGVASQNASLAQQGGQFNAGLLQDAGKTNLGAQLTTNGMNSSNTQAGMAGLGGLLSQASGAAGNQDMYDVNKAININQGLLQPYLNKNATPTTLTPTYSNTGASALGGAMAGLGLYNQFAGMNRPPTIGGYSGAPGTVGIGGVSMNMNDLNGWRTT